MRAGCRAGQVAETDPAGIAVAAAVVVAAAVEYCGIAAVASFVEVAEVVVKAAEAAEAFVEAVEAGWRSPLDPEDFADLGVHLDFDLAHLVAVDWLELVA